MISGTDDRLAFVIETEARLDGIRAARAEVRGFGTDSQTSAQKMAGASRSQAQSIIDNTTLTNLNIGAFVRRGEAIDKNSLSALAAYRAEGDALAANMASMGATEKQLNQIGAAITKLEQQAGGLRNIGPVLGPALPPGGIIPAGTEEQLRRVPGSARTAANALSLLGNAALYGTGSVNGMIVASGGLATGLAALSKSATVAAAASGIGAIVTIAALAATALYRMGDAAKVSQTQVDALKNFTAANVQTNLAGIRAARDQAQADALKAADAGWLERFNKMTAANLMTEEGRRVAAGGGVDFSKMEKANQLTEEATKITLEKLRAERLRVLALADQARYQERSNALEIIGAKATEGSLDTFQRRRQEIITQAKIEDDQQRKQFEFRNEAGVLIHTNVDAMNRLIAQHRILTDIQLHELTQAEQLANAAYKRTVATAVAAAGDSAADRYAAKLDEINANADLDLKAGHDAVEVERNKQAQIRALRKDTWRQAGEDAKSLTNVLIDSGSKQVRAVGHAAETIRRVVIGAQAAHAAVEAAIEGGKAIGSLAAFDFRGAALHGAAALELAKAAALGAQESLGGGVPSGGGGGAGAGSGGGSTFEPRSGTEGQGMVTINLLSQNPYGAEQIQQVSYLLQRGEILKRPIPIGPTTQLLSA